MLTALSGSDWGWSSNLLQKVYQTSLLSEATYAGGGWLPLLSASSVETLNRAQNRNLRIITGQLASTPTDALRVDDDSNPSAVFETEQPPLHWKGRSDSNRRPT
jgi:hypothetical protein